MALCVFVPPFFFEYNDEMIPYFPGINVAASNTFPSLFVGCPWPLLLVFSHSLSLSLPPSLDFPSAISIAVNPEILMSNLEIDGLSVTHSSNRTGPPDLRLIHYNDVYHVE